MPHYGDSLSHLFASMENFDCWCCTGLKLRAFGHGQGTSEPRPNFSFSGRGINGDPARPCGPQAARNKGLVSYLDVTFRRAQKNRLHLCASESELRSKVEVIAVARFPSLPAWDPGIS